jgi:hypothetical protein
MTADELINRVNDVLEGQDGRDVIQALSTLLVNCMVMGDVDPDSLIAYLSTVITRTYKDINHDGEALH